MVQSLWERNLGKLENSLIFKIYKIEKVKKLSTKCLERVLKHSYLVSIMEIFIFMLVSFTIILS